MQKLKQFSNVVNDAGASGIRLATCWIERSSSGEPDEFVIVPVCNGCGQLILDFDNANLVVEEDGDTEPIGRLGRFQLLLQPGRKSVYHVECDTCDTTGPSLWRRLSQVFNRDQRSEWEK